MKIGQVAKILSVSTTTIRNYLKFGSRFFSESATRQKGKNISSWDLDQLEEVQRLLGEGVKFGEIPEHLTPIPATIELDEPEFVSPAPPQNDSALITQSLIEQIHQTYQLTLDAKDQTIATLQAELERERQPWFRKWLG